MQDSPQHHPILARSNTPPHRPEVFRLHAYQSPRVLYRRMHYPVTTSGADVPPFETQPMAQSRRAAWVSLQWPILGALLQAPVTDAWRHRIQRQELLDHPAQSKPETNAAAPLLTVTFPFLERSWRNQVRRTSRRLSNSRICCRICSRLECVITLRFSS